MKKYSILLLVVLLCSCVAHKKSCKVKKEELFLEILPKEDKLPVPKVEPDEAKSIGLSTVIGFVAKPVISYTVGAIKKSVDREAEKYTATYKTTENDKGFYTSKKEIISFVRNVEDGEALRIGFEIEYLQNETFMKIKPTFLKVNYTKAKIAKKKNAKFVIKADISFKSAWIDVQKKPHIEEISKVNFLFKDVKFNQKYTEFKNQESKLVFAIPKNYNLKGELDNKGGYYNVEVSVTEIDQRKKVLKRVVKLIDDNEDDIVDGLYDLIEKNDDDEEDDD